MIDELARQFPAAVSCRSSLARQTDPADGRDRRLITILEIIMFTTRILGAALLALAIVAGGCQTATTSATGWGQIAAGVGTVLGDTKIDPQIEKVSSKLAAYCAEVQTAALAVDLLAPAKLQEAAQAGRIAVATFCAAPPKSVAEALIAMANAYAAIETARRAA